MGPKVVIDRDIPFAEPALRRHAIVVSKEGTAIGRGDLMDADALVVRTRTQCTRELLEGTRVRFIGSTTIGHDHIDAGYCASAGITWTNAPGCNASSVMQYVAAAICTLSARFRWRLSDMTLGIVGAGNTGTAVERFARAAGMRVLLNDPPRERREGRGFVPLERILAESDIITLHVPLTVEGPDRTLHLLDGKRLASLRREQTLINTARGEVVDGSALSSVLATGGLAACVIDVWEHEPTIDRELLKRVTLATPHIAGHSLEGRANGAAQCVRGLGEFFGLPLVDWYPEEARMQVRGVRTIECVGKDEQGILEEAVLHTFDIAADDAALQRAPERFEAQRTTGHARREFSAHTMELNGCPWRVKETLRTLGFRVAPAG